MSNKRSLFIIALVAIVNALGYGIIIPVLYSYTQKFGLSDFENGLLFAVFSLCQFISTPIIGRLSDRYGRRPLLLISLVGTAMSFFLMAYANSSALLFFARILDGITAGNVPVLSAIISDTTSGKERVKGFGILGAAFGFGFVFGPAISALTGSIGDYVPFVIAGVISMIAVVVTYVLLPETNKYSAELVHKKLWDFTVLVKSLFDKDLGKLFAISLIYSTAFSLFIYSFQPFSVKMLGISVNQISLIFTVFGAVGLITQTVLMVRIVDYLSLNTAFKYGLLLASFAFFALFFTKFYYVYILVSIVLAFSNSLVNPLQQSILSKEVDAKSQGSIMGFNASYMSIGQILGPIIGGVLATISLPLPFIGGSILAVICFFIATKIPVRVVQKESAF